jgi:O-antigen/teichoic acid export membrane protein
MSSAENLKSKTYRGAFWSLIDAIGMRFVQFAIGIVLARLLLPEQFGLIAMVTIFMAIAQTLLDSGFGAALIQKKEVTDADTSSVFYFNIIISLFLAGILCLAAPWIASFYSQPDLLLITQVMSLLIVINSFAVVQTAMLTRNVDFKTQTKVSLLAGLSSGGIGITMAFSGFGVWSLVTQQISAAGFRAILLWLLNPWRPNFIFSFHALSQMFSYGSRLLASGLLNQIFENLYYVVIGKLFSPMSLGFYTKARNLAEMPSMTLSRIIGRVTFPVLSSIQEDNIRLKRAMRKSLTMLFFINTPVMIGLAVVAEPLVMVLLTEKWLPSVPYLQLLCIIGLLLPFHTLNLGILMAKGRSDLFLRLEIFKKVLTIISISVTWRWGITGIIWGQVVIAFVALFLNSYYTGKLLGYHATAQIRDIGVYLVFSLLMGSGIHLLEYLILHSSGMLLFFQIISGAALYFLVAVVFRPSAFLEGWEALRNILPHLVRPTVESK